MKSQPFFVIAISVSALYLVWCTQTAKPTTTTEATDMTWVYQTSWTNNADLSSKVVHIPPTKTICDFDIDLTYLWSGAITRMIAEESSDQITKRYYLETSERSAITTDTIKDPIKGYFNFLAISSMTKTDWDKKLSMPCDSPGWCEFSDLNPTDYIQKWDCMFQMISFGNSWETPADLVSIVNPTKNPNIRVDNSKVRDHLIVK